jgi:MoxR-like ATPase
MNIQEVKDEVKKTIHAYLAKNEFEEYIVPRERQRPVFIVGAPGLGKTAIMKQIASELNIGLLSYTITHHTRQSAIGLPFITKKT